MLLGLGVAASWFAASAESGEPRSDAPAGDRVVVAPVNLAVRAVAEVEPGIEPVWRALLAHLSARQRTVALDRKGAGVLWNEVMAEEQQAAAGGDLYTAYRRFASRVAEQAPFGRIVFPTIVVHAARLSGHSADWDGVHRLIDVPGRPKEAIDTFREGKIWINREGVHGQLAAASLHVAVLSPAGELIHEGTGGLVLLQELRQSEDSEDLEIRIVMRRDPFEAPDQLREGIEVAFGQ
jgi:hypothetical protein